MLDLEMSAVAWMMQCFPEVKEIDDMRKSIGRYGLSGKQQASQIYHLFRIGLCRIHATPSSPQHTQLHFLLW